MDTIRGEALRMSIGRTRWPISHWLRRRSPEKNFPPGVLLAAFLSS
jgi:hypothetical protein